MTGAAGACDGTVVSKSLSKEYYMLLPSTYFGPVSYFRKIFSGKEIVIDIHEHYLKQTFRNRCTICGPNGEMNLVIPVHARNHCPMKDVTIEYSENWQRKHWGAIRSSYGQSPYFDFYAAQFEKYFTEKKIKYLTEMNEELLNATMNILKMQKKIIRSQEFIPYEKDDHRLFSKLPTPNSQLKYTQVFSDRFPFQPDLSIIDLVFCCGPESKSYLHFSNE
ncbi:MAG: WbqC family protein [Bacteroidetes bacterium]|nr:WbqC family protein [Bacteroidota bacterium]